MKLHVTFIGRWFYFGLGLVHCITAISGIYGHQKIGGGYFDRGFRVEVGLTAVIINPCLLACAEWIRYIKIARHIQNKLKQIYIGT